MWRLLAILPGALAVGGAATGGDAAASRPAGVRIDYVKDLLENDLATDERDRFFVLAGDDGEVSVEEFLAGAKLAGSFVRKCDRWNSAIRYDADESGQLNWPEAEKYRKETRRLVLSRYDRNRDGKLTGSERDDANALLAQGLLRPRSGENLLPAQTASLTGDAGVDGILKAVGRDLSALTFTDAQKSQVRVAHEKLSAGVDMTNPRARSKFRNVLYNEIVSKVLSADQRVDLKLAPVMRDYRGVKFSDEQKAKIRAAYKLLTDADVKDRKKHSARAMQQLRQKVINDVMTAGQRTTMAVKHLESSYGRARLTAEQKGKLKAAYERHTRGVKMSDEKARTAAMKKVYDEIDERVLTEKQREAIKRRRRDPWKG